MKRLDVLVVGGGLAGCAVAWNALDRGWSAGVIDAPRPDTSSRVAAGLVTPITGARFAISWRWAEFFQLADEFYRNIETATGSKFWNAAPAWRWFQDADEANLCMTRWFGDDGQRTLAASGLVLKTIEAHGSMAGRFPWGGISMEPAARLDTLAYLSATRRHVAHQGGWYACDLELERDVIIDDQGITIPRLNIASDRLVLCQGIRAREVPWFPLPLHPARGDILEVRNPSLKWDKVVHHEGWIVPVMGDRYLIGATYERDRLDTRTDDPASMIYREELLSRWCAMTGDTKEDVLKNMVAHRAAVRPASYDRHPLIGMHPRWKHIACVNGLGSKGSLMAPKIAAELLGRWCVSSSEQTSIEHALDWQRKRADGPKRSE